LRPISNFATKESEFKKWLISWRKEIINRSKNTDEFTHVIFEINHELARKIINYKELKNKFHVR